MYEIYSQKFYMHFLFRLFALRSKFYEFNIVTMKPCLVELTALLSPE
jgi:hypothetical protein